MNIIIGIENIAPKLKENHIVLPLDTFLTEQPNTTITAYCVVENIPIDELPSAEHNQKLHTELLDFYAQCRWQDCYILLDELAGCWGKEVDSFYTNLRARIKVLEDGNVPENWTPFLKRQSNTP